MLFRAIIACRNPGLSLTRTITMSSSRNVKAGDSLPSIILYEGTPNNKVNIAEVFSKKNKGLLFAIPGAFTPGCTKTHLPGYVSKYEALIAKGVDIVACVAVNDPFVMDAFGKSAKADGKILMLADPAAEFTKAMGMDMDLTAVLGNVRSKRYAAIVERGVVKEIHEEPDGTGLTCSLADSILAKL